MTLSLLILENVSLFTDTWHQVTVRSMSYQYRVAPNTDSKIVLEVCEVVWLVLMSNVFIPLTKKAWKTWATEYCKG
ncbi:hypothetical protein PR048_031910 [Dryococelus australis]|uniref:Uncharacterized protein n=1 Tax=Dryococelus australis TaxID=614101 RepID=A0ABQ9G6M0_9NEOP|nr:hypothetical protein PR048_031910 [Dryococelus australis]